MRKDVRKILDENFNQKFCGVKPLMVLKHISVCFDPKDINSTFFKIYLLGSVLGVCEINSRKQLNKMITAKAKKYHFPKRFKKFGIKDMENAVQCSKDIDNAIELSIKKKKMKEKLNRLKEDFI
jgi:hypothetical protein